MAREITCGIDEFASSLEALVGDIPQACGNACEKAVGQSVRKTAKGLRGGQFGSSGKHAWSDEYMSGFSSRTDRRGLATSGEIGNKNKPGLVHLLEKGHATLTGRRTAAYPHMAPAFDDMAEDFEERIERCVGEALS